MKKLLINIITLSYVFNLIQDKYCAVEIYFRHNGIYYGLCFMRALSCSTVWRRLISRAEANIKNSLSSSFRPNIQKIY